MSSVYNVIRNQNQTFNRKLRTEVQFRAYLLIKERGMVTIQDVIDSMGVNPDMVREHLVALNREGAVSLRATSKDHKGDLTKITVSFDANCEIATLRAVSNLLKENRFN